MKNPLLVSLDGDPAPGIIITRFPYEEPRYLNLRIAASNGRLGAELEYYCNAEDLKQLGKQFSRFTGARAEQITYELGSEKPEDRFAFFLSLRARPLDSCGHCAVLFRCNNNQEPPQREVSEFAISADVADLNRLGQLFTGFSALKHRRLEWRVTDGSLTEDL